MDEATSPAAARRAGVREVAALAGVSPQTVSRVINEHPYVRAETRDRVHAAMAQLGFRVNNAARALGTRRTRTLGVIASNAALFGPAAGLVALDAAARAAGRWVATAYADAVDESSTDAALEHLLAQGIDGVVVVAPRLGTVDALGGKHPAVTVTALPSADGIRRQQRGARLAVDHLAGMGHSRIARLGGPGDWVEEAARADGFADAMRAARLEAAGSWTGDWSAASGAARAAEIGAAIRSDRGPTAVVVANDQMALGLIAALAAGGATVPRDVSIIGFDDNADASYYRPALTTVAIDVMGEARRSVADALGLAPDDVDVEVAEPRLVVRDSTAPPSC
jgi:DNA-binding LacI/PurR family transcriptional regulator